MFAISIDFSWCWYTLGCFRSVRAAAVLRLLHIIAEHNNLVACLGYPHCFYPIFHLFPYPYIVMPLGQDYLSRCVQQLK